MNLRELDNCSHFLTTSLSIPVRKDVRINIFKTIQISKLKYFEFF